ncbi:MAG: 5-formyltetrahydrofolate cyclo-ligase [Paludibacteraceae bacterium]
MDFFSRLFLSRKERTREQKDLIREKIHILKKKLNSEDKEKAAEIVFSKIEKTKEFKNARTILVYWSTPTELPTHQYVKKWCNEKTILLPSVHGDSLCMKKFVSSEDMYSGSLGIEEPNTENFDGKVDLAIIPGVAFDLEKNRMGRGRGFYDNFLSVNNISTFGVGYDFQIIEKVPVRWGDMKMKKVISPNIMVG